MTLLDRKVAGNGQGISGPRPSATLVDLLRRRADDRPEGLAYAFLDDGGKEGERLSYGDLDREARRIGAWLQESGTPGDRALLLFPAGLDFLKAFFGCLYAGAIAIPAPPPEASRLKRTLPRLRSIAGDAGISVVISNPGILELVAGSRDVPGLESIAHLDIGTIPPISPIPGASPGSSPTTWPISSTPRARRRAPRGS